MNAKSTKRRHQNFADGAKDMVPGALNRPSKLAAVAAEDVNPITSYNQRPLG